MAKKGEARERLTLQCSECKEENYRTEKTKKHNRTFRIKQILSKM
jgi:ribosomal protein L33, bacterial type